MTLHRLHRHATDTTVAKAYGAISEVSMQKVYSTVTDVAQTVKDMTLGFPNSVEDVVAWITVRMIAGIHLFPRHR